MRKVLNREMARADSEEQAINLAGNVLGNLSAFLALSMPTPELRREILSVLLNCMSYTVVDHEPKMAEFFEGFRFGENIGKHAGD